MAMLRENDPQLKLLLTFSLDKGDESTKVKIICRVKKSLQHLLFTDRRVWLVNEIHALVEKYGFDGVDIDWDEKHRRMDVRTRHSFTCFIEVCMKAEWVNGSQTLRDYAADDDFLIIVELPVVVGNKEYFDVAHLSG